MSAPLPPPDAQCRQYIHEMLGFVRVTAEAGQLACEIGDDAGLEYQLRRLIAYVRAATTTYKDMPNARRAESEAAA